MNPPRRNTLIEGPVWGSLMRLAVPIVAANLLQTAYNLTDTFWVGRLGAESVAAVSISFPIIFLLISLGAGLSVAGTILVAQYKGRGNQEAVDHVASQTFFLMLAVSLVLSLLGYILSEPIVHLLGVEPEVGPDAVTYLQVSFWGLVFLFGFFVFQSLMRGVGDVTTPMLIVLGTVLLNLFLDPLFIFGFGPVPGFGVSGAAVATLGTQSLATIAGIVILSRGKAGIRLRWRGFRPDLRLMKHLITLGIPASIEQSTRALGLTVMIVLVTNFGTVTTAAYGIGTRILSFVIIPALGLSMATSTLVGQNIGAGQQARAGHIVRLASVTGFIVLTGVGVVMFFTANFWASVFIPDDHAVIVESAEFIRIMALTFGFIGIQQVLNGAFRGAGNTLAAMLLAVLSLWVLRFPLAYILSTHTILEQTGLWWAFPLSNIIAAVVAVLWFARGAWLRSAIIDGQDTKGEPQSEDLEKSLGIVR